MNTAMRLNNGSGPRVNIIKKDGANGFRERQGPRYLGMGYSAGSNKEMAKQRLVGAIQSAQNTPTYQIPTIDHITWHFDGPLTDAAIQATFGSTINMLTNTTPEGAVQIDTTFADPGKFQTFALICGIQWKIELEPYEYTAPVNLWSAPPGSETMPVSPDVFTMADLAANGTLGMRLVGGELATETMVPGQFEYGWWAAKAAYHMMKGYNLQWQYGHNYNIINESLANTAYITQAGNAGASSSEVDIAFDLRKANDYYRNVLASTFVGLPVDHIRLGNMTLGAVPGLSVFKPSRSYERVGATYGGGAARMAAKGNSEFRRLSVPFLAWPGVSLGLKAQVSNSDDQLLMQQYLSASCGFGPLAGLFTPDANITSGACVPQVTVGVTSQEPSLDNPIAPQFVQMMAQRGIVKGGTWKMTMAFKGYELTPDQANLVQDIDMRAAIQSECGCGMGPAGA